MQIDNAVPQPVDKPSAIQAEVVEGSTAAQAAAHVIATTAVNNTSAIELSDSVAQHAADGPQAARTRLLERVMKDSTLIDQQKLDQIKELTLAWDRPTTVSSIKSNSRSSPPEPLLAVFPVRLATGVLFSSPIATMWC